jgi:hypothetical protein
VLEDKRAVFLVEMLVWLQTRSSARKQAGQRRLTHGKRIEVIQ